MGDYYYSEHKRNSLTITPELKGSQGFNQSGSLYMDDNSNNPRITSTPYQSNIQAIPLPDILAVGNNKYSNSSPTSSNTTTTSVAGNIDFNDDDLEMVLQNYLSSETDVDLLTEKLGKQLSTLETEMVVGILDSGLGVNEIISHLGDKDETHLTGVTAWIEYYNKQLQDMKKYIEHIESKNNKMEVVSRNQNSLLKELDSLLKLLTLDDKTIKTLTTPDFSTSSGLENAIAASAQLKKALTTKLKSGMENMVAVKDQRKQFETYKISFSRKVSTLIESIFKVDQSKDYQKVVGEELPEHTGFYHILNSFKPLMHWLKEMDADKYPPLVAIYIKSYRSAYKHENKDFFSALGHSIIKESKDQSDFFSSGKKTVENVITGAPTSTPTKSNVKKRTIDKVFRYCLSCLETSIMAEQKFTMEFFQFHDPPRMPKKKHHHHHHNNTTANTPPTSTNTSPDQISPPPPAAAAPQQEETSPDLALDLILSEMFDGVVPELRDLVEKANDINPFYLLTMLGDTEQYISSHSQLGAEHSSFIIKILSEVQKTMKSLFNKFIDVQVEAIKATQSSLKRCGVLSHFKHFPIFVKELEKYRSKNEEESITSLINSSYYKIVVNLYGWLDSLVEKLPSDQKYRFISKLENYYFLTVKLEELNIECLLQYREQSLTRYKENLDVYTNYLIGLKFQPLMDFYSKMDELLLTLPPSDIQFQQSHSKQQYKKMVEKFKTENIEKGLLKALSNIYKNITKDSSLINVVWGHLEDVFIERYDHFQDITQQCYQQTIPVNSDQIRGLFTNILKKNPNKTK
ncbi:hypothetical protein CYY_009099 [Polysphondylium violaceum]|uniref:Exocyst complex component Sec3 C-terminal domain-containing protein n=1 Tax=Polysphondylium violaceum TaxID=133409 RepID=A0A8J4UWD9_9MYCE|nr:hypothetical protein CYY_009099 [Polysphondylium violaceum]